MSARRSHRLQSLKRSNAVDETSPPISVAPLSTKRTRRLRKTENLIYFSPDSTLKKTNAQVSEECPKKESPLMKPKTPRRKIIRAKRILSKQEKSASVSSDDEKTTLEDKQKTQNKGEVREEVECFDLIKINGHDDIEVATEAAKNQTRENDIIEEIKETENKSLDTSKQHDIIVTTLKSPISPSTSSEDLKSLNSSENGKSSFEHFQFDSSKEFLQPSTSGCVEESAPRRRTFELESSVNDISLLKVVSLSDSHRMNSFPSEEDILPSPIPTSEAKSFSKITLRRKLAENNIAQEISVSTPPRSQNIRAEPASTPPVTPLPAKKPASLLKNVLDKENNKSSTAKKLVSAVKVPNFAAIHRKVFERMESLSEYKQRKEQRAKMLLSGRKPEEIKSVNKKTPKKESRKQLRFAANVCDTEQSPTYIPLPSTPLPKNFKMADENVKIKTPLFNFTKGKENPFAFPKTSIPLLTQKIGKEMINKNKIPVRVLTSKNNNDIKSVGCKKEELKLMVATKSKMIKNTTKNQREIIKGVRSNRRFELLMNMRKGK